MPEAKVRCDAWGERLDEELRWKVYDTLGKRGWGDGLKEALAGLGVEAPPRSSWYRFLERMRRADAERRITAIATSVAEAQGIADRAGIKAEILVETMKTLAIDRAMTGDDRAAVQFAGAAATIWDRAQREQELKLKDAAQRTRDEQLKLAREKFEAAERRLAAVAEVADAARGGKVDPAKVADEIDRILGRKK